MVSPATAQSAVEFADLSLHELLNETVTTVSKREQKLFDTASAVFVLSNTDIRRSGATHIADALRLVPGMNVASVSSNQWAISSRGFNNVFANKLLVLVDGRAVYSPLFAGVYWDAVQSPLEDVDRVEVVRGPGATVWGANAVNGVINIVTRGARDTQGGLLYGSAGDVHETNSGVRYGGRLGDHTYYRVYASAFSKDDSRLADGSEAGDSWGGLHGGVRIDHHPDAETQLTWMADTTELDASHDNGTANHVSTLGRLTKKWSDRSSFEIQAYYDWKKRNDARRALTTENNVDLSVQQTFGVGEYNDIIVGVGYRASRLSIEETEFETLVRDGEIHTDLFNFFVQDELRVVPDKLTLTAGVKIEHNDFTGVEIQPSLRAVLKPTEQQTVWAAASRAVRTPSALEGRDVFAMIGGAPFPGPGGVTYFPRIVGDEGLKSEVVWAYELGYRVQATQTVNVDLAIFYNEYENFVGLVDVPTFVGGVPFGTAELAFNNAGKTGHTYGGEISVAFAPSRAWRLSASYSLLIVNIPGRVPENPYERASARNQVVVRSSYDFTSRTTADVQLRYVDTLQEVPSYLTADLRIGHRINDQLEVALVGQNLFDSQHLEQSAFVLTSPTEVPRGFYAKAVWHF